MKKKVLRELKAIAGTLPDVLVRYDGRLLGSDILSHNPLATDQNGNKLSPGSSYVVHIVRGRRVSHLSRIKAIYKKYGHPGVEKYVREMNAFAVSQHADRERNAADTEPYSV